MFRDGLRGHHTPRGARLCDCQTDRQRRLLDAVQLHAGVGQSHAACFRTARGSAHTRHARPVCRCIWAPEDAYAVPTPRLHQGPRDKRRETRAEILHTERGWIRPAAETPRRLWHDPVPLGWPNLLLLCGWAAVDTVGTAGLGAAHRARHGKRRCLIGSLGRDGANATGTDAGRRGLAKPPGLVSGEIRPAPRPVD